MNEQPPPPVGPQLPGPTPASGKPRRRGETFFRVAESLAIGLLGAALGAIGGFAYGYHEATSDCSADGWCELGGLILGVLFGAIGAGVGVVVAIAGWAIARALWEDRRSKQQIPPSVERYEF